MKHTTKTYRLLSAAILSLPLLLSACQAEQPESAVAPHDAVPLAVTATIAGYADGAPSALTRAATGLQTTQLENQQRLSLYFAGGNVTDAGGTSLDGPLTATANGSGALTLAQPAYVALGEEHVWVDAFYPQTDGAGTAVTNRMTQFTVARDQSQTEAGTTGYRQSDLMYATTVVKRPTGSAAAVTAALTLRHLMAKLTVTVGKGDGVTYIKAVRLVSGWRTIKTAEGGAERALLSDKTTLADHSGLSDEITPAAPVTMYSLATNTAAVSCSALLPPQQLAASQALLEVETDLGTTRYRFEGIQTLAGGCYYELSVTPSAQQAGMSVTLTGWANNEGTLTSPAVTAGGAPGMYYVGTTAFKMVYVKGGAYTTFMDKAVTGTLTDFYLSQTLVTQKLYKEVMGVASVTGQKATGDNLPMAYLSWADSYQFIDRLNRLTDGQRPAGYRFSMPTEAQWEYAARGGIAKSTADYAGMSGSLTVDDVAWHSGNSGNNPQAVASKEPNELGLYDMCGNEQEWVHDFVQSSDHHVYTGPTAMGTDYQYVAGTYGSTRGGSYANTTAANNLVRVNTHNHTHDGTAHQHVGIRLCLRRARVGELYFSDGTWGTLREYPSKTPVGVVFSNTTTAADQARGFAGGYAVALRYAADGEQMAWCTNYRNLQTTHVAPAIAVTIANVRADLDGLQHCLDARQYCAGHGIPESNLTAVMAAAGYRAADLGGELTVAAPPASSGWYLPSAGQWYAIAKAAAPYITGSEAWHNGNNAAATAVSLDPSPADADAVKHKITAWMKAAVGNATLYEAIAEDQTNMTCWSSTELLPANGSTDAQGRYVCDVTGDWSSGGVTEFAFGSYAGPAKSMALRVRPVLAF